MIDKVVIGDIAARCLLVLAAWVSMSLPIAQLLGRAIRLRDRDELWVCAPLDLQSVIDQHLHHHARSCGSLGVEL